MRLTRLTTLLVLVLFLAPLIPSTPESFESRNVAEVDARNSDIVVSELFRSPNQLKSNATNSNIYNAVDWNNDGDYGKYSDQFIELWNTGSSPVNVSDWVLSSTSGSPPCQLAWNTVIDPDQRIVVFSADSDIVLSYFEMETVSITDTSNTLANSMTIPKEFGFYGNSIVIDSSGTAVEVDPSPGWGPNDPDSTVALNIVKCFKVAEAGSDAFILKGRVVTMESENSVMNQGNVLVRDGMIEAVWSSSSPVPISADLTNAVIIETNGTIYPGLIDLHNHVHYNHIPLWDFNVHLNENDRSDEGGYTNRHQWGGNYDYGPSITWMKNNIQQNSRWGMASEQMKYAEVQAVAGGVTAIQGSPGSGTSAWDSMLARNVELYNFGQDGISTCAVCGAEDNDYTGSHLISQNQSGSLNAWFVHLAEGVDDRSKDEFDALWDKGLIMDETVVIHGTALDRSQFDKMATVGADLVWSPISNLLLYGNTTNVRAADAAGVTISLAPDWGPSGSKNNLHELKTADLWNQDVMDSYFTNYELAAMVTSNPAKAASWGSFVGQLKPGMYADLVVMDTFHDDPYRNLIEAIDADVRLTVVHGKAVFGDTDIMTAINQDDWEPINGGGISKAVDVTSLSEVDGSQTWESIESGMAMAMRNDVSDIRQHWSAPDNVAWDTDADVQAYLDTEFDGKISANTGISQLKSVTVDPIFTTGDERYFDVINRSSWANTHIDLTKLYDYYDISMDADGDRNGINVELNTDEQQDDTSGNSNNDDTDDTGSNDNSNDNTDNTDTNDDTNSDIDTDDSTNTDCLPEDTSEACADENDGLSDTDASSSDSTENKAVFALIGLVIVIGGGLFFAGRSGGDELNLNQEAMIEKMWDDEVIDGATKLSSSDSGFVPALPPMDIAPPKSDEEE